MLIILMIKSAQPIKKTKTLNSSFKYIDIIKAAMRQSKDNACQKTAD